MFIGLRGGLKLRGRSPLSTPYSYPNLSLLYSFVALEDMLYERGTNKENRPDPSSADYESEPSPRRQREGNSSHNHSSICVMWQGGFDL
jgi:hypothetical protein